MPRTKGHEQVPYQNRHQSELRKALHTLPGLELSIRCQPQGVVVRAFLHVLDPDGKRRPHPIADVTFRPAEVTEEKVVQWGIGALSTYLQRKAEAIAEAVEASS